MSLGLLSHVICYLVGQYPVTKQNRRDISVVLHLTAVLLGANVVLCLLRTFTKSCEVSDTADGKRRMFSETRLNYGVRFDVRQ